MTKTGTPNPTIKDDLILETEADGDRTYPDGWFDRHPLPELQDLRDAVPRQVVRSYEFEAVKTARRIVDAQLRTYHEMKERRSMTDLVKLNKRLEAINTAITAVHNALNVHRELSHDKQQDDHLTNALIRLLAAQVNVRDLIKDLEITGR